MDTLEAIYQRRSIKAFDPEHRISADDEKKLFDAVLRSPTSFNIQHWRFVVIRDPKLRQAIREVGNNQSQMTDASLLVLMVADSKAHAKQPERYWSHAPKEIQDMLVGMLGAFYEGREWLQRDEAQRSIGMAMQTLMLAATSMGYQSCPMIGFDIEKVAELVKLPADHVMGPLVAIGKGIKEAQTKGGLLPMDELLIENTF